MAEESNKNDDIFYRVAIYPDAEGIFSFRPKSLKEIKDECFVVLDTNALLVPYTTGKDSLEQIGNIYSDLVHSKRLVVPGQVAREFAEHRVTKLKELYQQISRKRAVIGLGSYPLLGNLEAYQKAMDLEIKLNDFIRDYNSTISAILDEIVSWYWDDPVSKLYGEIFAGGVILDPSFEKSEIKNRLEKDMLHKLPPGYKDARKNDEGVGDLLIWQTILEIGKTHNKSVIFVSLDQKPDWWNQSEGRPLYTRYELIDEFRRVSKGQSFHAIKFSSFLTLFGASEEVVEEVRKEEVQARVEQAYESPRLSTSSLYFEIERELKEIFAGLGLISMYKSYPLLDNLKVLERRVSLPSYLIGTAKHFLHIRDNVIEGILDDPEAISSGIDSGIAVLKALKAIPYEVNVVYHPGVELYTDKEGTKVREGVLGVILETTSPGGASKSFRIFPTTRTHFIRGKRVAYEWSSDPNKKWGETWYRDPHTGEIKFAWSASMEFIGRNLDETI